MYGTDTEAIYSLYFDYNNRGNVIYRYSCTVLISKGLYFLGGTQSQARQISRMTPRGLLRVGNLPEHDIIESSIYSYQGGNLQCPVVNNKLFICRKDCQKSCIWRYEPSLRDKKEEIISKFF